MYYIIDLNYVWNAKTKLTISLSSHLPHWACPDVVQSNKTQSTSMFVRSSRFAWKVTTSTRAMCSSSGSWIHFFSEHAKVRVPDCVAISRLCESPTSAVALSLDDSKTNRCPSRVMSLATSVAFFCVYRGSFCRCSNATDCNSGVYIPYGISRDTISLTASDWGGSHDSVSVPGTL